MDQPGPGAVWPRKPLASVAPSLHAERELRDACPAVELSFSLCPKKSPTFYGSPLKILPPGTGVTGIQSPELQILTASPGEGAATTKRSVPRRCALRAVSPSSPGLTLPQREPTTCGRGIIPSTVMGCCLHTNAFHPIMSGCSRNTCVGRATTARTARRQIISCGRLSPLGTS